MNRLLTLLAVALVAISAGCGAGSPGTTTEAAHPGTTTVAWNAKLTEPSHPDLPPGSCPPKKECDGGTGEVTGLGGAGQVREVIIFEDCGGPRCDVRTLTFADGSTIVLNEVPTPAPPDSPASVVLKDTIVGGTGRFAAASGAATGEGFFASTPVIITLMGTVKF